MDNYEKKILELELSLDTPCELKHREFSRAVNYISQQIGYDGHPQYTINIPICEDCLNGLKSPEWILIYCLKCTENQWVYKPLGRLEYYGKHILWTSCCPSCKEPDEKVSIFFTE